MTSYSSGNISVDRDFARFGSKTSAITKINTVDVRVVPPKRGLAFILIVIGVLIFLGNLAPGNQAVGGFVTAAMFMGAGALLWMNAKPLYQLFLMTSSSEVQAYESKDQSEIMELRHAVESKMVGR